MFCQLHQNPASQSFLISCRTPLLLYDKSNTSTMWKGARQPDCYADLGQMAKARGVSLVRGTTAKGSHSPSIIDLQHHLLHQWWLEPDAVASGCCDRCWRLILRSTEPLYAFALVNTGLTSLHMFCSRRSICCLADEALLTPVVPGWNQIKPCKESRYLCVLWSLYIILAVRHKRLSRPRIPPTLLHASITWAQTWKCVRSTSVK